MFEAQESSYNKRVETNAILKIEIFQLMGKKVNFHLSKHQHTSEIPAVHAKNQTT